MLKKRNVATMMAVATAAASVAPVFAAQSEADVVKSVSSIDTVLRKGDDNTKQLVDDLRFLLNEGTKFEVVDYINSDREVVKSHYTTNPTVEAVVDSEIEIEKGSSVYSILLNGKEIKTVVEIENAISALKTIGNVPQSLEITVIDKGHALVDGKISAFNGRGDDLKSTYINKSITVIASDANVTTFDVEELFDGEFLTEKGFEVYSAVKNSKNLLNSEEYELALVEDEIRIVESEYTKEHTITFTLDVNFVDSSKENEKHTVIIKGKDLAHTTKLANMLNDDEIGVSRIAGNTRFKTAIKIAKELYPDATTMGQLATNGANTANIVLVNCESMIDGLTATPLATMLDAPVVLTDKNEVQADTLEYIKSIQSANKDNGRKVKVTVVGGTGVVFNDVVRQLEKLGIEVERIGGADRHATSVEVGIKMRSLKDDLTIDKAFIVAATGEADAMSIAPVAAREDAIAPIIVEGFTGMSTTANELLKNAKEESNGVDLIGGKITEETQKLYAKSGDFIYGAERYDTNAKVVEKYYRDGGANAIYVAKDGMAKPDQLVDSLAVGTLAAKEDAAIILATDKLSTRQAEAIKSTAAEGAEITQIGGGLNFSTVVKGAAKILGFTK